MLLDNVYCFVVVFHTYVVTWCFTVIKLQFIYISTLTPSKTTFQPHESNTKHKYTLIKYLPYLMLSHRLRQNWLRLKEWRLKQISLIFDKLKSTTYFFSEFIFIQILIIIKINLFRAE